MPAVAGVWFAIARAAPRRLKELAAKDVQFSDYRIKVVLIVGDGMPGPKGKDKAKK